MAQELAIIGFSCTTLMLIQFLAQIISRKSVLMEGHSAAGWNNQ